MKIRLMLLALAVAGAALAQDISVTAPTEARVSAQITVSFSGPAAPLDFITIVAKDSAEGTYDAYQYAKSSPVLLTVPALPGEYEIRYLDATSPLSDTLAANTEGNGRHGQPRGARER